eukprot:799740-Rhodomonas_salina.2
MGARAPKLSAVGIRLCPTSRLPRPTAIGDTTEVDAVKYDDYDEDCDTALTFVPHPQVASAASTTIAEHLDSNYELDTASKEKRDIAYLFENMIRYVRPSFDDAVTIYGHQMNEFGRLTTTITTLSACLTGLLVVAIAVNVLRARAEVIKVSRLCLAGPTHDHSRHHRGTRTAAGLHGLMDVACTAARTLEPGVDQPCARAAAPDFLAVLQVLLRGRARHGDHGGRGSGARPYHGGGRLQTTRLERREHEAPPLHEQHRLSHLPEARPG